MFLFVFFVNLRRVPVPVCEIRIGNGERLEQFHDAVHLAIIGKSELFGFFHDENTIAQTGKEIISVRLFRH